ncbi:MAG: AMP-binding protein [Gammaproteobacteria bacterium]|nr:AMP-binding protein [Gammaproteobacteria bacterium]
MAGRYTSVYALEKNAIHIPGTAALVQGNHVTTYRDLDEKANQVGRTLIKLGVERGDRFTIALTNCTEFVESTFGAWKLASITVPLNYRFMDDELVSVVDSSDSVGIVLEDAFLETFTRIWPRLPKVKFLLVVGDTPTDQDQRIYNYAELVASQAMTKPTLAWAEQGDHDVGYNIYTGGTTGMPKGISYNERALLETMREGLIGGISKMLTGLGDAPEDELKGYPAGRLLATNLGRRLLKSSRTHSAARTAIKYAPLSYNKAIALRMSGSARGLVVSPMMHSVGWGVAHALPRVGGTVYMLEGSSFDPKEALDIMEKNNLSFIAAIGDATLKPLLAELDKNPRSLPYWTTVAAVGMPTSPEVKEGLLKRHLPHATFIDCIGGSELTGMAITTYTAKDTNFGKASFPTTESVLIIDPKTGVSVKAGEIGELARKTKILPNGYYKDPEKTKQLIREINGETWVMSGDLAMLDENGTFHFAGRGSECINTGGEKVYPEEVENLIKKMDGIEMVGLTATPDDKYGELVTAVIELKKGVDLREEDIINYTKGKISGYKRPRRVIFTDEFPRTLIGKPHYKALRDLAKQPIEEAEAL